MSSFRDKINSKLNANTKPAQQKITSFDQTWLKITVVGGQTQLCPIKLNCQWVYPNISNRPPQLNCKWFNKTQNSMTLIQGVNGSYYQPSLIDVGTIIHVQCVPQLEDAQYEGMPIIKQIGPVKIDPQTNQQANDLLNAKKATFSAKIRNMVQQTIHTQGLIKIQSGIFRLTTKINQIEKQLINTQIYENNPILKCMRVKSREIQLSQQNQQNKLLLQLTSNKVRDVFVLLVKLIAANREQTELIQDKKQIQQITQQTIKNQISSQVKVTTPQTANQQKIQNKSHQNIFNKNQQSHTTTTNNQIQQIPSHDIQKQGSAKQNNSKKSQKSEQQIHSEVQKSKKNNKNVGQVKSSQDLSSISSPIIAKKHESKPEQTFTTPSGKANSMQILQIADLKKQLRANQGQIYQLKKTITQKNDNIESLHDQILRMKQRQANLSCNYFQLQDQVKKMKQNSQKSSQQVSYYKNQNRILKTQNQNIQKKNKSLVNMINQLQQKLTPFLNQDQKTEQTQTYADLKQKYLRQVQRRQEIDAKYQYTKQQTIKIQQKYNQIKESLDKIEGQKNFYKKKYQNISQQLQLQNNQSISSPISQSKLIKSKITLFQTSPMQQKVKVEQTAERYDKYQLQILDLKKQLKIAVQQNNFLRQVNTISSKDKKSTSKQHLKLQLAEMKKIANRLTQTVTEKDLALENIKKVNRQINQKLIDAKKRLDQFQKKQSIIQSSIKNVNSSM